MTEFTWLEIFGDNLRDLMAGSGMTQKDLARELDISESAVSQYVNGRQFPGVKTLVNMAYVLECSMDDLLDFGERID